MFSEFIMTFEQNVEKELYIQFCKKNNLVPCHGDSIIAYFKQKKGVNYGFWLWCKDKFNLLWWY